MKKVYILFFMSLFLISCWDNKSELNTNIKKQDFFIETKKITDFTWSLSLNKTTKISSSQNVKISSQAVWRVKKILVKEWEYVKANQVIVKLDDSIANYWLSLEKAKNLLDKSRINYESTKISLDKQVYDSQIIVDKLQLSLSNLDKDSFENIKKAKIDIENYAITQTWSKSNLELEKLENTIKKQELDLENKKISDNEIISWYKTSIKKDYSNLSLYLNDIIEFSDKLLWVTIQNRDKNNAFENYLWAKDSIQKIQTENYFNELLSFKTNQLIDYDFDNLSNEELNDVIKTIISWYEKSNNLLNSLEKTLNNSLENLWSLSQSDINNYISSVNQYQSTYLLNYNSILSFKNSVVNFLNTYKSNYESINKQISLLKEEKNILKKSIEIGSLNSEVWYNKTILNYNTNSDTLNIDLKSALNNLEIAKQNREITLKSLENSINDADINYRQALDNIDKLNIISPIDWSISNIMIDIGQEVGQNKELFTVINNWKNEVLVSFSKEELSFINVWDIAYVKSDNKTYTWSIYSISNVADSNLKYISTISLDDSIRLLWDIVEVIIPYKINNYYLPINVVKVDNNWNWIINIIDKWDILQKKVKVWKIYWSNIEILDFNDKNLDIILSNLENYDKTKFNLKIK